jgi:hypothetical protein
MYVCVCVCVCVCGEKIVSWYVKCKMKLSLDLIYYVSRQEEVWGSGGLALPSLSPTLNADDWLAVCPCRFNSLEIALAPGMKPMQNLFSSFSRMWNANSYCDT